MISRRYEAPAPPLYALRFAAAAATLPPPMPCLPCHTILPLLLRRHAIDAADAAIFFH